VQHFNGKDALDYLDGNKKPDLILLDIMMPGMSGYDVCRKIREEFSSSELPIIMLTAKNRAEDLTEGFKSGANDYLPKPFAGNELTARIESHLELSEKFENDREEIKALKEELKQKYRIGRVTNSFAEAIISEMKTLMEEDKIFRNPLLSLSGLAERLKVDPRALSQIFSLHLDTTFYNYINRKRVLEIEKNFKDPSKESETVLSLAYSAGFNSKSVFNTSFKKITGSTPSKYKKQLKMLAGS